MEWSWMPRRVFAPETDEIGSPSISNPTDAQENEKDSADILADRDLTGPKGMQDLESDDTESGGLMAGSLEDEPADFIRGELDVVEQMDLTIAALDSMVGHHDGRRGIDDEVPRTRNEESDRSTNWTE